VNAIVQKTNNPQGVVAVHHRTINITAIS